jgi:ribose 5-phosphate isomerase B
MTGNKPIAIGSDHGGYELKLGLVDFLKKGGYEVLDLGTHSKDSCDYPIIGFDVAKAVSDGKAGRGMLICKTGIGMTVIANKVHGVRAAACYDTALAKSSREHNDCNVLVLAANYCDINKAREIAEIWLKTEHVGERHGRRVGQIRDLEKKIR